MNTPTTAREPIVALRQISDEHLARRGATSIATFGDDLKTGAAAEGVVANLLGVSLGATNRDVGDMMAPTKSGVIPLEIKMDRSFDRTGNIALELADVHPDKMVGTGVGKQSLIGAPSLNCHIMGTSGKVALYEAATTLEYMRSHPKIFSRLVSVRNKGYSTVNGITAIDEAPYATVIELTDLREWLSNFSARNDVEKGEDEIKSIVTKVISDSGHMDDSRFFNKNFYIKKSRSAEPIVRIAFDTPRRSRRWNG
jgi:hypothetical protein